MFKKYKIKYGDTEFDASEYQCKIFDCIEHGSGNIIISAAAGSAKTTTIVNSMRLIPKSKKLLYIAFNKNIVEEIKKRIGDAENVTISTFHSLGYSIFRENNGGAHCDVRINEFKYHNYVSENIDTLTDFGETKSLKNDRKQYISNIITLVDYSRYNLAFTKREISEVADKYKVTPIRDEISVCRKVLKWGESELSQIDFTDMIWIPNVLNYTTRKSRFDWVLIDEAQDVTVAEEKMIEKCLKRGFRIIVTGDEHQMINVWCGSDRQAIDNFRDMPNTKEFRLPISYRCPKIIVEMAKRFTDNIEAYENAIEGEVNVNVKKSAPKDGDMVLCRITSPLIELYQYYLRINKKAYIRGYETIKERYLSIIERSGSKTLDKSMLTVDGLFPKMCTMLLQQVRNVCSVFGLSREDAILHQSVMEMFDVINGIRVLSEGINLVSELKDRINTIFTGNEDGIQLSTIHKAKGLEADNVYILMPSLLPIKHAKKDWELETEKNLEYVAITRTKKTLNYIKEDGDARRGYSVMFGTGEISRIIAHAEKIESENSENAVSECALTDFDTGLTRVSEIGNISKKPVNKAARKMSKLLE